MVAHSFNKSTAPSSSFATFKINSTTFLIIEDDKFEEKPFIYVKVYQNHLVVTDTGCDAPRISLKLTSLREYLETHPLSSNGHQCLNPRGQKKYIIICSHCHYDHILGIPHFLPANPMIIASDSDRRFLLEDFPSHSLCKYMDVSTPEYKVSKFARHMESLSISGRPFRIQFLQIPGHTPDSLAWYDIDEYHLYIGDMFYQRKGDSVHNGGGNGRKPSPMEGAIIFPEEGGNWIQFMASLDVLLSFVLYRNRELTRQHGLSHGPSPRVCVGCGHLTHKADAEKMILEVQQLFKKVIIGEIPIASTLEKRGVVHNFWLENDHSKYSMYSSFLNSTRLHKVGLSPKLLNWHV